MRITRITKLGIPAMERHSSLYKSLNDSCLNSNLTSWTKHVNKRGSVYTIRFDESTAILDPNDLENSDQAKDIIYKPKSRYHIERDSLRMKGFNASHSFAKLVETNDFCDISHSSVIHLSEKVSDAINQDIQPTNHAASKSIANQGFTFCSTAQSQAMSDSHNTIPSAVKQFHASESHIPPLQFDYESIDTILPLVHSEVIESTISSEHLERAESIFPPVYQPPAEQLFLASMPVLQVQFLHHMTEDSYIQMDHTIPDSSFESQRTPESGTDMKSTLGHFYSPPPSGYVEKYLSSKDLLCNSCSATVPKDTDMLYCDTCSLHLCGNCLLSKSYSHSLNCIGLMRYMNANEMHLQKVPDSNDNSLISERSRPPEYSVNTDNQIVPSNSIAEIKDWFLEFNAKEVKRIQTSIEKSVRNACHDYFSGK